MAQPARAAAAVKDIDAAEPMWSVIDRNATSGSRTHHPLGLGQEAVVFNPGKKTQMPQEIAAKFLCDPAFHVFDPDGNRVTALRQVTAEEAKQGIVLAEDEVIAKFDELSQESLLRRAHLLPGGEAFKKNARRDDLVEFLLTKRDPSAEGSIGAAKRAARDAGKVEPAAEGVADAEMSDAELDAMLSTGD